MIKKLFCRHENISCISEANFTDEQLIIIKTRIECDRCKKTFKEHPKAQCCYVHHIHGQLIRDKYRAMYDKEILDKKLDFMLK